MVEPKNVYWKGKYPVVGLKIDTTFERTAPEKVARFRDFFVPDVSDWVGVMYTMEHSIRPGYAPMKKLLGTAFTVKMPPGDNLMLKKALSLAKPGDVLVVDARGHVSHCCGGGEMMVIAKRLGIAGMVVDGAYRDLSQIQSIDFPIFCKGVHPSTGPKREPGEIGGPVSCGGVVVHSGDVIVGCLRTKLRSMTKRGATTGRVGTDSTCLPWTFSRRRCGAGRMLPSPVF